MLVYNSVSGKVLLVQSALCLPPHVRKGAKHRIICDWFTLMVRDPLIGFGGASTLLAQLLTTDQHYCNVGQTVLDTLCCSCTDIDFSQMIADALVSLSTIFKGNLPTFTC